MMAGRWWCGERGLDPAGAAETDQSKTLGGSRYCAAGGGAALSRASRNG
jgi:hypothetical protein